MSSQAPSSGQEAVFDEATALARLNGSRALLERFLRLFRERNSGSVAAIGAALAGRDLAAAHQLTHSLIGVAGTVGMIELQGASRRLEALLLANADAAAASAEFSALTLAWTRVALTLAKQLDEPQGETR